MADDLYGKGAQIRREVLGESEMDLAEARAGEVDAAFERYVTEAVWGTVWAGGGLDRRTRSLLVVALSARQGDDEDLLQHLRATRKTGATMAEIREAIMMVGVYAGIPAANRAMRLAKRVHGEEHGTSP